MSVYLFVDIFEKCIFQNRTTPSKIRIYVYIYDYPLLFPAGAVFSQNYWFSLCLRAPPSPKCSRLPGGTIFVTPVYGPDFVYMLAKLQSARLPKARWVTITFTTIIIIIG